MSDQNSNSEDQNEKESQETSPTASANPLTGRAAPDTSRDNRGSGESGNNKSEEKSDNGGDSATRSDANNKPKSADAQGDSGAQQAASRAAGRPMFELPFACGEDWELTTYAGHDPDDSKVDFFSDGGTTEGAQVVASAGGTVTSLPDPGGVKIDHGGGWYTLYLHMEDIGVSEGQDVQQGDDIGTIGAVGTGVAHLHYEQLYNPEGGEAFTDPNIRLPKFGEQKVQLVPDSDYPTMTSQNGCS